MKKIVTMTFATLLLVGSGLFAQRADIDRTGIVLQATGPGAEIGAQGLAMKVKDAASGQEIFKTRAFADCPDGTVFVVRVGTVLGEFDVGIIKMNLGSGLFEMKMGQTGEKDIGDINTVMIRWDKKLLLEGKF